MSEPNGKTEEQQDAGGATAGTQDPSCIAGSWSLHPNNIDQPSLKFILSASTSSLHRSTSQQLPSYEDAIKSCSDGEPNEGRILSTCLNTGKYIT